LPSFYERFAGLRRAGAGARGVDNASPTPGVDEFLAAAWSAIRAGFPSPNPQLHPRIRPWRDRFAAMGVSGKQFPSSVEALVRRALKNPDPLRINPLVDFYNAVSLRYAVPAGGFDLAALHGDLELRLTRAGERFLALDADAEETVRAGEVAYADGATILTRHFVWRQARAGLITPQTRDVFLVSEILGEVGEEVAAQILAEFRDGVARCFSTEPLASMLDAARPEAGL
ncbi:MAG: hypothetical protein HY660_10030, partial [Armatimonadetes bacterium]|nr:hypothetical protein [Armatimonadota bacterium]